jgi:penicillin G amidase
MNEHLPEPLIYAAWMRAAGPADPRRARPAGRRLHPVEPVFIERVFRNIDGARSGAT